MRARPVFTAELINEFRAKARDLKAAGGPDVKIGTLKHTYERGFRGDAPEQRAMAKVDSYIASLAKAGRRDQPRKPNGEFASSGGADESPVDETPADRAKRAALYAAWAAGFTEKPERRVNSAQSPFNTPKSLAAHRTLQHDNAGYEALTSGVIPEKRYELAGSSLRWGTAGAIGLGVAIGLRHGRVDGRTARAAENFGRNLGGASSLLVKIPASLLADAVTMAHAKVKGIDPKTITRYRDLANKAGAAAERRAKRGGAAVGRGAFRAAHAGAAALTRAVVGNETNPARALARRQTATLMIAAPITYGISRAEQGTPLDPEKVGQTFDEYSYRVVHKAVASRDLMKLARSDEAGETATAIRTALRKSIGSQPVELGKSRLFSVGAHLAGDLAVSALGAIGGGLTGAGQAAVRNHLAGKKGNPYHDAHGRFTSEGSAETDTARQSIERGAIGGAAVGASLGAVATHRLIRAVNMRTIQKALRDIDSHALDDLESLHMDHSLSGQARETTEAAQNYKNARYRTDDAVRGAVEASAEGDEAGAKRQVDKAQAAQVVEHQAAAKLRNTGHAAIRKALIDRNDDIESLVEKDPELKRVVESDKLYGASSPIHYKSQISDAVHEHIADLLADKDKMMVLKGGKLLRLGESRYGASLADRKKMIIRTLDDGTESEVREAISGLTPEQQKTVQHFLNIKKEAVEGVDANLVGHEANIKKVTEERDKAIEEHNRAAAAEDGAVEQMKRAVTDDDREAAKIAHKNAVDETKKRKGTAERLIKKVDNLKDNGAPIANPINGKTILPRSDQKRKETIALAQAFAWERATKKVDDRIMRKKRDAELRIHAQHARRTATVHLMAHPVRAWNARTKARMVARMRQARAAAMSTKTAEHIANDVSAGSKFVRSGFSRLASVKARINAARGRPEPQGPKAPRATLRQAKRANATPREPTTLDHFRNLVHAHDAHAVSIKSVAERQKAVDSARAGVREVKGQIDKWKKTNPEAAAALGADLVKKEAVLAHATSLLRDAEKKHVNTAIHLNNASRAYKDALKAHATRPKRGLGGTVERMKQDAQRGGSMAYAPIHRFIVQPTAKNFRRAADATPKFVEDKWKAAKKAGKAVGREMFTRPEYVDGKPTGKNTIDPRKIAGIGGSVGALATAGVEAGRWLKDARQNVKNKKLKPTKVFSIENSIDPLDQSGHFGISIQHPKRKDDRMLLWGERYDGEGVPSPLNSFVSMNDLRAAMKDKGRGNQRDGDTSFLQQQDQQTVDKALDRLRRENGTVTIAGGGVEVTARKDGDQNAQQAAGIFRKGLLGKFAPNNSPAKGDALYNGLAALFSKRGAILKAGAIFGALVGTKEQNNSSQDRAGILAKQPELSGDLTDFIDNILENSPPKNDADKVLLKKAVAVIARARSIPKDTADSLYEQIQSFTPGASDSSRETVDKSYTTDSYTSGRADRDEQDDWNGHEVRLAASKTAATIGSTLGMETVTDQAALETVLVSLTAEGYKSAGLSTATAGELARRAVIKTLDNPKDRELNREALIDGEYKEFREEFGRQVTAHRKKMGKTRAEFVLDGDALDDFEGLAKAAGMPSQSGTGQPKAPKQPKIPGAAPQTSLSQILNADSMLHAGGAGAPPAPQKISMKPAGSFGPSHDEKMALRTAINAGTASVTQFTPFGLRTAARREISDKVQQDTGLAAKPAGPPAYKVPAEMAGVGAETLGATLIGRGIRSKFGVQAPDTDSFLGAAAHPINTVKGIFADGAAAGVKRIGGSLLAGGIASGAGAMLYSAANSALGGDQYSRRTTPGEMGVMALGNMAGTTAGEAAGKAIVSRVVGRYLGADTGEAIGASLGTLLLPGAGTAVGAAAGTFAGEVAGGTIGASLGEALGHFGFRAFAGYPKATVDRVMQTQVQSNRQVVAANAGDTIAGAVGQSLGGPKLEGISSLAGSVGGSLAARLTQ